MGIWYNCFFDDRQEGNGFNDLKFTQLYGLYPDIQIGVLESLYENVRIFAENEAYLIGIDGMVANRVELSKHLDLVSNSSEEEVIFSLYRRYGAEGFFRLQGTASIVFYDSIRQSSIFYRSLLNGNPLYYVNKNFQLTASTDPISLLRRDDISDTLSYSRLCRTFSLRPNQYAHTLLEDISAVEQGELIVITKEHTRRSRQPLGEVFQVGLHHSEKDTIETYSRLLEEAVAKSIQPNEQYGIMLSSGMDSSSIAVLAAKKLREEGRTLRAYSWTFPNDTLGDESQKIQELCHMHDIPLTLFDGEKFGPFDRLDKLYFLPQTPFVSPFWHISAELYRIASKDGVTRLFNGNYGDLLFPVRNNLLIDAVRDKRFDLLTPIIGNCLKRYGWRGLYKAPELRRPIAIMLPKRKVYIRKWLTREAKEALIASQGDVPNDLVLGELELTLMSYFTDSLGVSRDLPGYYGIERIEPHRDLKLIEFAAGIPSYMSFRNGETKYYAREAMRGLLPESIRTQPRAGDLNPFVFNSFYRNKENIREMIFGTASAWNGYIREEWMLEKFQNDAVLNYGDILVIWLSLYIAPWQKAIKSGGSLYEGHAAQNSQTL